MKQFAILAPIIAAFAAAFFVTDSAAQLPKPQPDWACTDKLPDLEKLYPGDLESRRKAYGWNRFVNDRIPSQPTTYLYFEYPSMIGKAAIMKRPVGDGVNRFVSINVYRVADWGSLPNYEHAQFLRRNSHRDFWDNPDEYRSRLANRLKDWDKDGTYRAGLFKELNALPKPTMLSNGLTRYETLRVSPVFVHPTGKPSGPYDLPKFDCDTVLGAAGYPG